MLTGLFHLFICLSVLKLVVLSGNPLSFLRNQPQFHVMRQLIQQNAALLPALLQEIGRENPELLQVGKAVHAVPTG